MNLDEFIKDFEKFYSSPIKKAETLDILEKNIERNGETTELTIIMEELAELIQQVSKKIRKQSDEMHLLEEIADVYICLAELKIIAGIRDDEVEVAMTVKLARCKNCIEDSDDFRDYSGLLD